MTVDSHLSRASVVLDDPRTLKGLIDVDGLFGAGLKVWNTSLGFTEGHGTFGGYLE